MEQTLIFGDTVEYLIAWALLIAIPVCFMAAFQSRLNSRRNKRERLSKPVPVLLGYAQDFIDNPKMYV